MDVINEPQARVVLPFCKYHYFIVSDDYFKARKNHQDGDDEWSFSLEGPFDKIALIEKVVAAIEMVRPKSEEKKP